MATSAILFDQDEDRNPWAAQNQQQQPMLDQEDLTMTQHITTTRYTFVTTTRTHTRYVSDGVTAVPAPVQTWYGAQKAEGCDKTACASCRFWYKCQGGGQAW